MDITILGGGAFGTVLADMLANNGHHTHLWARRTTAVESIQQQRCNNDYLPGVTLHADIHTTNDIAVALATAELVILVVPSHACREVAQLAAPHMPKDCKIISGIKGIESSSRLLMTEVLEEIFPNNSIGALSGPNLAAEIVQRQLTGSVIASRHSEVIAMVQEVLHNDYFRVYASDDVRGVQLSGALKNIYAIMAGIAVALGTGYNSTSLLVTRGLVEMSRFALALGANPLTFLGLSGVGDLIATCTSGYSRNFQLGNAFAQGKSLTEALDSIGHVVEGINTLKLVKPWAEALTVPMPLLNGLYDILFNHRAIQEMIVELMLSEQTEDIEFNNIISGAK